MTLFPVLVDVYHKEQLVTKEEAKKVVSGVWRWEWSWAEVAITKDVVTAARIGDILDEHGFNDVARHIRGKCVYSCLYVYVNTIQDPFEKAQLSWILAVCCIHASLVLSVCVYIDHYSKLHVNSLCM